MLCPDCFSVSRLLTIPRDLFYSNRLSLGSAEKKSGASGLFPYHTFMMDGTGQDEVGYLCS